MAALDAQLSKMNCAQLRAFGVQVSARGNLKLAGLAIMLGPSHKFPLKSN